MKKTFRSSCPIASMLDIVGDKWSLLIIRDMLLAGKKTFKDFSSSIESIAPGILSSRLKMLESVELITKRKLPENNKENIYLLTEKGIELVPLITEMILWSDKHVRPLNTEMYDVSDKGFDRDKSKVMEYIQFNYRELVKGLVG